MIDHQDDDVSIDLGGYLEFQTKKEIEKREKERKAIYDILYNELQKNDPNP